MKIIKSPWKNEFLSLIKDSKHSLKISSPYIKENICDEILSLKNDIKIDVLTSFTLLNLYNGSLDINAVEKLVKSGAQVKNYSKLHAKIYIFDDTKAVVSSANLTNGGLVNNFEYGVFVEEKEVVDQIINDYELLYSNVDTGTIKEKDISIVKKILEELPKKVTVEFPRYDMANQDENLTEIILPNISTVTNNLTRSAKEVFLILNRIQNPLFTLQEAYAFENDLKLIFPNNNFIRSKIRQQLQVLRDLGLVKFLGNSRYEKLWQ